MQKYQRLAIQMANHFDEVKFIQVLREKNSEADEVAHIALSTQTTQDEGMMTEIQTKPSIKYIQILPVEFESTQMSPILSYIQEGKLPEKTDKARRTRV